MKRLLVVEDDPFIKEILVYALKKEKFEVLEASDGEEALSYIEKRNFDLALLDVMLPDTDGFTLCKKIITHKIAPVIMLTARNDISDKLTGLGLGADDYITKPFDIREVIARINIVLKRNSQTEQSHDEGIQISVDTFISKSAHEVIVAGEPIKLKLKEYRLLLLLAENRNIIFSRDRLLELVWGYDFNGGTRTVDVHIQRLRKKLGESRGESIIKTIFGVGYKLG